MAEEGNQNNLANLLKNISFPDWVKRNILTAIGKGLQGIILEASEVPKSFLHNYNERIKLIGEIKRNFIKQAAEHPLAKLANDSDFAERALKSYGIKIFEEQYNKELIAYKTLENLKILEIQKSKEDKPIDNDWLTSFWNLAATKSEEEIQAILSKILANEITSPGSLSLHTLQTLSILDSKIGKTFQTLCNISIDDGETAFVIHPKVFVFQNIGLLDDYGINFPDLLYLDGSNLIRSAETIRLNFGETGEEVIDYASLKAKLDVSNEQLHLIYFTQAGRELRRLIKMQPLENYTRDLKEKLGNRFQILNS